MVNQCKTRVIDTDQDEIDLVQLMYQLHFLCDEQCNHRSNNCNKRHSLLTEVIFNQA